MAWIRWVVSRAGFGFKGPEGGHCIDIIVVHTTALMATLISDPTPRGAAGLKTMGRARRLSLPFTSHSRDTMSSPDLPYQPITSTLPSEFSSSRVVNYMICPMGALNPDTSSHYSATFAAAVASPASNTGQPGAGSRSIADILNASADELGCAKGPLHWVAFEYANDRPAMQFCGSAFNCTDIYWSNLPWGCYVIATRGPLETYKPRSSSLLADLELLACTLQPPFVSIPKLPKFYGYSSVVLFHNRLYNRATVFPERK